MPFSSGEGKDWIRRTLREAHVHPGFPVRLKERDDGVTEVMRWELLDIGPGAGAYADMARTVGPVPHLTCVEIYEPYVDLFKLDRKYDHVIVGDARLVPLPRADVVILGDVLEHMTLADAVAVWGRCRAAARFGVWLSLPIVPWPQGPERGNEHEAHLHTWSHELVLAELDGITDWWTGQAIGVYRALSEDVL